MLNPIFWKKVQGQKHPGRWEIVERKIPSVKMLFKTNTNGHKHPIISLIIIEQDAMGETKENKWHLTQEPRTPKKQSYRLWWGAASPILTVTPCACIYTSYNQNSYKECIRIDKYKLIQSFWTGTNVIRRKHIVQPTGFGAYSSTRNLILSNSNKISVCFRNKANGFLCVRNITW